MIVFPNCKINLGLDILRRRSDGYHDIETVMVPAPLCDILEIVPGVHGEDTLEVSGNPVDCPPHKNLVMKAIAALRQHKHFNPVDVYLHKNIPDGAGLGGGSADAAFAMMAVNDLYNLGLNKNQLADLLAGIGSDCPFFVYNRPMLATGTGTTLTPIDVDLSGYEIVIEKPANTSVSTAQAYSQVNPHTPATPIVDILKTPVYQWQTVLKNDFEPSVFAVAPQIAELKQQMLDRGADYAAMSGSGAAVFGLFKKK